MIDTNPVDLKSYNTLRLPALTERMLLWQSLEELEQLQKRWRSEYQEILVLGSGSNLVLTKDVAVPCLRSTSQSIAIVESTKYYVVIDVDAGYIWDDLVWFCLDKGWYGLENMVSIPGTAGAAPVQNIGAYGCQIGDLCLQVRMFDWLRGEEKYYDTEQCNFSYRDSVFKPKNNQVNKRTIITSIRLKLGKQADVRINKTLAAKLNECFSEDKLTDIKPVTLARMIADLRERTLPNSSVVANVGSFFHNPVISLAQYRSTPELQNVKSYFMNNKTVKISAASLIQANNWKGYTEESGAGVSGQHALVLVNTGTATGTDIMALANKIKQDISDSYGIKLTIEPAIYK